MTDGRGPSPKGQPPRENLHVAPLPLYERTIFTVLPAKGRPGIFAVPPPNIVENRPPREWQGGRLQKMPLPPAK